MTSHGFLYAGKVQQVVLVPKEHIFKATKCKMRLSFGTGAPDARTICRWYDQYQSRGSRLH